ncbi:outer membrane beta-barrel protein [Alcanivorax nanhaiticus]|uniref:outer membrane beta-barrel protein n=1 Tax=Alcanivorax nanhaiticus TaxID=1177154 RepID=UPI00054FA5F2|nr:outer membrane beta-barrel protein [Alcanivorax nanhaiticus]
MMTMKRSVCLRVSAALLACSAGVVKAGPYVGAQLGYDDYSIGYTDKEPGFGDLDLDGLSASGGAFGVYGGLRFGGEGTFFAVELNAGTGTAEYKETFESESLHVEAGTSYGLGFLVGTEVNAVQLYGRFGAQRTDFDLDDGISNDSVEDETPWGLRVGIGAELPLNESVSLRADWSRTMYDEIVSEDPFSGREFTYEPEQSAFQLGVTAHF